MRQTKWMIMGIVAAVLAACLLAMVACNGDTSSDTEAPVPDGDGTTAGTTDSTETDDATDGGTTEDETDVDTSPSDVVMVDVYPTPMEITCDGEGYVVSRTVKPDEKAAQYADRLAELGISVAEDGLPLTVTLRDLSPDFAYGAEEAYILRITTEGISIQAQTDRGVHYAFMTLFQLMEDSGSFPLVTVKDAPRNALRGVIEGFYGTAYTHEFRKELFAFMGQNKMNAYIYAPKDDAKHRARWRELYTGSELKRMTDLIETANVNHVKFIYAISPGGDINLESGYEADFEKLMAKCEQIYDLGCRDFAIFLDDIPTLDAEGHAKLLNDFQTRFVKTHEGMSDLVAITTEYTDPFLTDYTDRIAPLIHEDIELMWTGPGVVPASITNQSLRNIIHKYGRNVFIWWNYPVNDVLVNNLYMGACEGLEPDLYQSITGLVANPMNQGYASMVPLFTTADYLWNPEAYEGEDSLAAACEALAPDAAEALLQFIRMTCASPMNRNTDSVEMKALLDAHKTAPSAETLAALKDYFTSMVEGADRLAACEDTDLYKDIADWVAKYRAYGVMGLAYVQMEEAAAAGKEPGEILPFLGAYTAARDGIVANARLVSNYVLTPYFNTLGSRINQLLGLSGGLTCAPATPITDCQHYEDYFAKYMTDGDDSTYFWTAGTLSHASGNGVGYFGVDLGQVITVNNIYVATGVGGSDALYKGAFEYSTDNKTWVAIESGTYKDEILLENLSIQARYVRMKQTDKTNTSWTKVRAFEVNTNRTVTADPSAQNAFTTSLPTYQSYTPDLATDGMGGTFFWSSREGRAGDYIMLDVGRVTEISSVRLTMGASGHENDYIQNGVLEWSADGESWTTLCAVKSREVEVSTSVTARYFRVTVKTTQVSWITVCEFTALGDDLVSEDLWLDEYFVPRTELLALQDKNALSSFAPDGKTAEGHSLSVRIPESGQVRILASSLPKEGITVILRDATGKEIDRIPLRYDTVITAAAGTEVVVPLRQGLVIAEIL